MTHNQQLFKEEKSKTNVFGKPWVIMIVDDDVSVHDSTKLVLEDFEYQNRKLKFLNAYSGEEAKEVFKNNPDIAVVLLDVTMEEEDSGLKFVNYIRSELNNKLVRIILRTGQPGQFPERKITLNYSINDYKAKK